jgi:hypothetical protein
MKEQEQVSSMASDSRSFDRRAARLGGVSALSGAVLGMVGNLIWVPVHLGILVAFILMLGGLVAIHDSIRGGQPGALARFGLAAAIVGTARGSRLDFPRRLPGEASRRVVARCPARCT